jgi:UDPglucose 6-dehydrogenase
MCPLLAQAGAAVTVHDLVAVDNARRIYPELSYAASPVAAATDVDAIVLLTEWPQFTGLDPDRFAAVVRRKVVVDGRHALDATHWRRSGWTYRAPGRPAKGIATTVPEPRSSQEELSEATQMTACRAGQ